MGFFLYYSNDHNVLLTAKLGILNGQKTGFNVGHFPFNLEPVHSCKEEIKCTT